MGAAYLMLYLFYKDSKQPWGYLLVSMVSLGAAYSSLFLYSLVQIRPTVLDVF